MAEAIIKHMHEDLESLKSDIAVIKYILSEEGQLTEEARMLGKSKKNALLKYAEL